MFNVDGVCDRETGDMVLVSTAPRLGADCRDRDGEDDLAGSEGGTGTEPTKQTASDLRDRSGDWLRLVCDCVLGGICGVTNLPLMRGGTTNGCAGTLANRASGVTDLCAALLAAFAMAAYAASPACCKSCQLLDRSSDSWSLAVAATLAGQVLDMAGSGTWAETLTLGRRRSESCLSGEAVAPATSETLSLARRRSEFGFPREAVEAVASATWMVAEMPTLPRESAIA